MGAGVRGVVLARCWALRNQALPVVLVASALVGGAGGVGVGWFRASFLVSVPGGVGAGWVGVVFEIWIVDASI